jgi:hypothetical protein
VLVLLNEAMTGVDVNLMQVVPGFRVRIIPVMGTIPAIFGQVMATYVVTHIAGMPVQTEPVVNLDVEHYGILHQRLIEREELQFGSAEAVEVFSSMDVILWVQITSGDELTLFQVLMQQYLCHVGGQRRSCLCSSRTLAGPQC